MYRKRSRCLASLHVNSLLTRLLKIPCSYIMFLSSIQCYYNATHAHYYWWLRWPFITVLCPRSGIANCTPANSLASQSVPLDMHEWSHNEVFHLFDWLTQHFLWTFFASSLHPPKLLQRVIFPSFFFILHTPGISSSLYLLIGIDKKKTVQFAKCIITWIGRFWEVNRRRKCSQE